MAAAELAVRARGVHKQLGENHVLRGIDLEVASQSVVCIIGPSGSGKSTLLRCINHLTGIDRGRIYVHGDLLGYAERGGRLHELDERSIARKRAAIGMVFQSFNLFPHLTALENVTLAPVKVKGVARDEAAREGKRLLERVGLGSFVDRYPRHLSGGQQQRVAIARALAMGPRLMLFDEPTSALDPELVGEVLDVIRDLAGSGMTMIVVTHEIGFARELADVVAFMDEGKILELRDPKTLFASPQHPRTVSFLSKVLQQ